MNHGSCSVFLFVLVVNQATAAEYFHDTFEVGDTTPVVWSPGGDPEGKRAEENGWLVHTPDNNQNMSTFVDECFGQAECFFDDASLRTTFQVEGGVPTYVSLFSRSKSSDGVNATLYGGTDSSGNATLAMSIGTDITFLHQELTGLDPSTDEISLRFDFEGDEMSLWMWPAGTPQPGSPNVSAPIPANYPNDTGYIGFFYNPGSSASVAFDFFEAAPVPEPSGLALALFAFLSLLRFALTGRDV